MTFVYVLSNVQETVKRNVKRHIFLYILFCETLTFSLYSTRTSVMRTTDTFLAQSSDSHRTSTSLVLTLYSSAVTNLSFLKVKKRIAMFKALQYVSIGCIVDVRVLSRIYRLGEKSWVSEGHKVSKGSGGMPPPSPKPFQMNMCWDAMWCILRQNFLRNVTVCALTSSSLDDFSDLVPCIL